MTLTNQKEDPEELENILKGFESQLCDLDNTEMQYIREMEKRKDNLQAKREAMEAQRMSEQQLSQIEEEDEHSRLAPPSESEIPIEKVMMAESSSQQNVRKTIFDSIKERSQKNTQDKMARNIFEMGSVEAERLHQMDRMSSRKDGSVRSREIPLLPRPMSVKSKEEGVAEEDIKVDSKPPPLKMEMVREEEMLEEEGRSRERLMMVEEKREMSERSMSRLS